MDLTVRLQALDGVWETCGAGRYGGIVPENFTASADRGPGTCSFDLKRDPGAIHPDLGAYTPAEVEVNGTLVWSGRVRETPTREGAERSISVQGQGWQFHLDDDVFQQSYVHTRLGDWKDMRSTPGAALSGAGLAGVAEMPAAGQVTTEGGVIYLGYPAGTYVTKAVGVVLDMGPDARAKHVTIDWGSSFNFATSQLHARGADAPSNIGWGYPAGDVWEDAFMLVNNGTSIFATSGASFAIPRRYVQIFHYINGTNGGDVWWTLKRVLIATDDTYHASNQSALTATQVIKDALGRGTKLLSTDQSKIAATTFQIPDYAPDGYRTPREHIDAVNAFHDYEVKVDEHRRLVFQPRPSIATLEVGDWSGADFDDASANSGEEIYNRVIVQAQDYLGQPVWVQRTANNVLPGTGYAPQVTNPSFDTNTTGWSITSSSGLVPAQTLQRDTVYYDTAPAALFASGPGGPPADLTSGAQIFTTITGTFDPGVTYTVKFKIFVSVGAGGEFSYPPRYEVFFGNPNVFLPDRTLMPWIAPDNLTWYPLEISWTPKESWSSAFFYVQAIATSHVRLDSFSVTAAGGNLIDKRKFRRTKILPVSAALSEAGAAQIADTWLKGHITTPLKGALKVTGPQAVRRVLGGEGVHPSLLLRETGQLIRLSHRADPDTGGQGRDGTIVGVTYNHEDQSAQVQIDNDRGSFEALLGRLAVLQGAS